MYRTIIISNKRAIVDSLLSFLRTVKLSVMCCYRKKENTPQKNLFSIFGWFQFEFQIEYSASLYAPVLSCNSAFWCVCVSVCALYYALIILIITSMKYEYEMLLKFWNYKFYWFSLCSCVYWQMPVRHELSKAFMNYQRHSCHS